MTALSNEEALAWSERQYQERGFLTFVCRFPKEIGEQLNVQTGYLSHLAWCVIGPSSAKELRGQLPPGLEIPSRPGYDYFYRAEVMD